MNKPKAKASDVELIEAQERAHCLIVILLDELPIGCCDNKCKDRRLVARNFSIQLLPKLSGER
jgi:hypothetical protein